MAQIKEDFNMKTGMKVLEFVGRMAYKAVLWVARVVEGRK